MTILDLKESENAFSDYDVKQMVWGKDTDISVVFDNMELEKSPDKDKISLRGVVRQLGDKLKFVEENRSAVNAAIMSAEIENITEDDLRTLEIAWIMFTSFVDTGECELYLYLESTTDMLDGEEIAVTVHNDNTVTFDDFV